MYSRSSRKSGESTPATLGAREGREPGGSAGSGAADSAKPKPGTERGQWEAKDKRPEWETAGKLWAYWQTRKTFLTNEQRADAWKETAHIMKTYSDEIVDRWNKEIDTLLVYAGLFSAILTAFNVQSYQLLTPLPEVDPIIVALEKISAQLSSFSVNPPSVNSTQPAFVHQDAIPTPTPMSAVWLNALWFSSLIFSLSAASAGIMVKQWISEYNSGLSGTSRHVARLRQLRLQSLERWHVKEIVGVLPVLLQIALVLFLAGLLVLLWSLNRTVAIVATVLVGILAVCSLATIILPSIATHCSYLSPLSRAFFELTRPLRRLVHLCRRELSSWILGHHDIPLWQFQSGYHVEKFQGEHPRTYRVCKLLHPDDSATTLPWHGKELALLARFGEKLDGDMVAAAYTAGMDTSYLHHAAACAAELSLDAMRRCFRTILSANVAHWGEDEHWRPMRSVHPCFWSGAIIALMKVSGPDAAEWSPSALASALKAAYEYIDPRGQHVRSDAPRTRLAYADFARIIHHYSPATLPPDSPDLAEVLLRHGLREMLGQTAERGVGNDVRQYVASTLSHNCETMLGLDSGPANQVDDASTIRALTALRCIIYCVPPAGSADCKPGDPEYEAVRAQVVRVLDAFARFLSTSRALKEQFTVRIDEVMFALRVHGEQAGLVSESTSPRLVRALKGYLDAYRVRKQGRRSYWKRNEDWIEKLGRDLNELGSNSRQEFTGSGFASSSAIVKDQLQSTRWQSQY
ncbi:hypothetical protein C8T65DRAFT_176460 [Cerioporus squamosus]|nr:hypothetical protein C8T65DRAFT_176460 [Cerioporus squamosus]